MFQLNIYLIENLDQRLFSSALYVRCMYLSKINCIPFVNKDVGEHM